VAADRREAAAAIEAALAGPEVSAFALVDGDAVVPLGLAQDSKRVGEGDTGPNTGGMGAYSPLPWLSAADEERIWDVVSDTVRALEKDGVAYRGLLYTGLMLTDEGPKVLEYNCRFGDPKTEALVPRLGARLAPLLVACATGTLRGVASEPADGAAVTVVLASGGYPGAHETGREIRGLEEAATVPDSVVFHAGTAERDGRVVTAGGRVLAATGWGPSLADARARAYEAASAISFDGMIGRGDIAAGAAEAERGEGAR
ncbi:MAG TPA: phosphoribosylglycinamide synthetase C domain-containing protein, partial [Actinomycetota bacterium]